MTDAKLAATDCLGINEISNEAPADLEQLNLTEQALKRRKVSNSTESKFMDLHFIPTHLEHVRALVFHCRICTNFPQT